jgi:dinuclear metal center YbgI/SA1388 family protein
MTDNTISIRDVTRYLEEIAPLSYQESYDNAGLITGDPDSRVKGILVTLDCIESVVEEAVLSGCNLIVAHHPIVFRGLKRLTGAGYVERTVIKAIKNDIAIYAIHTNLDNVIGGVNRRIAEKIGLTNLRVLSPLKESLMKLVSFIPKEHTERVLAILHESGAGQIGDYKNCSFRVEGMGTFMPTGAATPFIGESGKQESVAEDRIEVIFPAFRESAVLKALRQVHPYEEIAYYLTKLSNENQEAGAGMIGELPSPMEPLAFLNSLKSRMDLHVIRHTALIQKPIRTVAVCGGAGSFLLPTAIRNGADVFVSADFKYHEFFDANGRIIVADIGHYESEVCTKELLKDVLIKKFPTFAIIFSKTVTNPISYI